MRFIDENLSINSNVTTGKIYWTVLIREKRLSWRHSSGRSSYHQRDKDRLCRVNKSTDTDIVITNPAEQLAISSPHHSSRLSDRLLSSLEEKIPVFIHVCLLPYISGSKELKSKPTQHSRKGTAFYGISLISLFFVLKWRYLRI